MFLVVDCVLPWIDVFGDQETFVYNFHPGTVF